MTLSVCRRVGSAAWLLMAIVIWPDLALAQFQPTGPAVGERFNGEVTAGFWNPNPFARITSEGLGIEGTEVDLVDDLGVEQKRLFDLRVVLRPALKHKFRFQYTPIHYEAEAITQQEFIFNGQRYQVGLPVNTDAKFTVYRFGYEYDFFVRPRGFIGAVVDLKYTDTDVTLESPVGSEFTKQVVPLPTFGVIARGYLAPNVSITGEMTYFKIPENLSEDFGGRWRDYDFYGTVNFTPQVGAIFGRRSIDVEYFDELDLGDLNFTGWYFAGVVRF